MKQNCLKSPKIAKNHQKFIKVKFSIFTNFHPIFTHFHPFSPIFTHFHPFSPIFHQFSPISDPPFLRSCTTKLKHMKSAEGTTSFKNHIFFKLPFFPIFSNFFQFFPIFIDFFQFFPIFPNFRRFFPIYTRLIFRMSMHIFATPRDRQEETHVNKFASFVQLQFSPIFTNFPQFSSISANSLKEQTIFTNSLKVSISSHHFSSLFFAFHHFSALISQFPPISRNFH